MRTDLISSAVSCDDQCICNCVEPQGIHRKQMPADNSADTGNDQLLCHSGLIRASKKITIEKVCKSVPFNNC